MIRFIAPRRSRSTAFLLAIAVIAASGGQVLAQDVSAPVPPAQEIKSSNLSSDLIQIQKRSRSLGSTSRAAESARQRAAGFQVRADGKILVELIGRDGDSAISNEVILNAGGEPVRSWRARSSAWIALADLDQLANSVPNTTRIEPVMPLNFDAIAGEGPVVAFSDEYRDAGFDGTGITIAVIDGGYAGLSDAQAAGDAPASPTIVNYTSASVESNGSHGLGCLESVYDHAPGATYRVYKVGSLTDVGTAVADCVANGVDVITHSLSWYNEGWADDTGTACQAAALASDNHILFFTSAGNRAQQHWKGTFWDTDSDSVHQWGGTDETLNMTVGPGGGGSFYLSWNTAGASRDFDLYLYDGAGNILAQSTNGPDQFERIFWVNPSMTSDMNVNLRVVRVSGPAATIEVFNHARRRCTWLEHQDPLSSITSPSNSTKLNVLSIAAVDRLDFGVAEGSTDVQQAYSSRGPSNSFNNGVDFSGPTNVRAFSYPGRFGGTSCATPNAAGIAAVLWSCDPSQPASKIRNHLIDWAVHLKDWGINGLDTTYGFGGIHIPELTDCNSSGTADVCEIVSGTFEDENGNGIPDILICEGTGVYYEIDPAIVQYQPLEGYAYWQAQLDIWQPPIDPEVVQFHGFSTAILTTPGILYPVDVNPAAALQDLRGGQGPEFFASTIGYDSVVLGVVFDFQGTESVIATSDIGPMVLIGFEFESQLLTGLDGTWEASVDFVDGVGQPPIDNQLAGPAGEAITPQLRGSIIEAHARTRFKYSIGDVGGTSQIADGIELEFDPADGIAETTITVIGTEDDPNPHSTQGFAFELAHPEEILVAAQVDMPSWIVDLNGGAGPEFLQVDTNGGDGPVLVAVVYGDPETRVFGSGEELATIRYETRPDAVVGDDELIAPLYFTDVDGSDNNLIVANGILLRPDTCGELIRLVPIDPTPTGPGFRRMDCNNDLDIAISDAVFGLSYLFVPGSDFPECDDACDANDNGAIEIADMVFVLNYLFVPGSSSPPPPIDMCGVDPTMDSLGCAQSACP